MVPLHGTADVKWQALFLHGQVAGAGALTAIRFRRVAGTGSVTCPSTAVRLGHTTGFTRRRERHGTAARRRPRERYAPRTAGATTNTLGGPMRPAHAHPHLALALALATLAACARSGGSGSPAPPVGRFTVSPWGSGATVYSSPLLDGSGDAKIQALVLAPEIGAAGHLVAIRLHRDAGIEAAGDDVTCPAVSLRVGHTTVEALGATFADNVDAGSLTTVFSGALTIPGPIDTWFEIPFAVPFAYDGTDNLVVELETTRRCSGTVWFNEDGTAELRRVGSWAEDADPDRPDHPTATGTPAWLVPVMQLTFSGGELRKAFADSGSTCFPLAWTLVGRRTQILVHASDLNGAGPLTGLAFQTAAVSPPATVTLSVRLAHSRATELAPTFAANLDGALVTAAEDVTIRTPSGQPSGTWLWIPLNGAFSYDGVRNLVVDLDTTGGDRDAGCTPLRSAAIAESRTLEATYHGDAVGTVQPWLTNLAFRFAGGPVFTPIVHGGAGGQGLTKAGEWLATLPGALVGPSGQVTEVWFRLARGTTPVAAVIPGVRIWMGTTARLPPVGLTDPYAAFLDAPVLAYSGALELPAGAIAGDWIRIPLQAPVSVDGSRTLAVLFTSDGGPATSGVNAVATTPAATRFRAYGAWSDANRASPTAVPQSLYDGFPQLRFTVVP